MELKDMKNAPTETLDKLAWNVNASADVLTELARNKNESIRKGVAWNPNTPAEALTVLAEDVDNYVSRKAAETFCSKGKRKELDNG